MENLTEPGIWKEKSQSNKANPDRIIFTEKYFSLISLHRRSLLTRANTFALLRYIIIQAHHYQQQTGAPGVIDDENTTPPQPQPGLVSREALSVVEAIHENILPGMLAKFSPFSGFTLRSFPDCVLFLSLGWTQLNQD